MKLHSKMGNIAPCGGGNTPSELTVNLDDRMSMHFRSPNERNNLGFDYHSISKNHYSDQDGVPNNTAVIEPKITSPFSTQFPLQNKTLSLRGGDGHLGRDPECPVRQVRSLYQVPPMMAPAIEPRDGRASALKVTPASFVDVPLAFQLATRRYLRGEAMSPWTKELKMELPELLMYLRFCLILLCEWDNPGLQAVTRDTDLFVKFRNGLNRNFLDKDSDYVSQTRRQFPMLNDCLTNLRLRVRVVLAFQTIDFPSAIKVKQDDDDNENSNQKSKDLSGSTNDEMIVG
ncbi:hypothetical protein F5Y16DRAFT_365383 [Xylariaceae sp. FL0255]|nr:hypothetical protein F5Y16DRAFT_365383 [Xylariaceae sp. FL0255]